MANNPAALPSYRNLSDVVPYKVANVGRVWVWFCPCEGVKYGDITAYGLRYAAQAALDKHLAEQHGE